MKEQEQSQSRFKELRDLAAGEEFAKCGAAAYLMNAEMLAEGISDAPVQISAVLGELLNGKDGASLRYFFAGFFMTAAGDREQSREAEPVHGSILADGSVWEG